MPKLTNREFNEQFLAFCEAKPADERYQAGNTVKCALGQFVDSLGGYGALIGYADDKGEYIHYPLVAFNAAVLVGGDYTFGMVSERMRLQVALFDAAR